MRIVSFTAALSAAAVATSMTTCPGGMPTEYGDPKVGKPAPMPASNSRFELIQRQLASLTVVSAAQKARMHVRVSH